MFAFKKFKVFGVLVLLNLMISSGHATDSIDSSAAELYKDPSLDGRIGRASSTLFSFAKGAFDLTTRVVRGTARLVADNPVPFVVAGACLAAPQVGALQWGNLINATFLSEEDKTSIVDGLGRCINFLAAPILRGDALAFGDLFMGPAVKRCLGVPDFAYCCETSGLEIFPNVTTLFQGVLHDCRFVNEFRTTPDGPAQIDPDGIYLCLKALTTKSS